jgi:signal recognition particle GTPase
VIDALLKELTAALLEADVNVKLVASLRNRVKAKVCHLSCTKLISRSRRTLKKRRKQVGKRQIRRMSFRRYAALAELVSEADE